MRSAATQVVGRQLAEWLSAPAQFLLIFLVAGVVIAPPALGELVFYDDRDAFMEALAGQPVIDDEFQDLENGYYADPIVRSDQSFFEYALGSSSIVGLMALDDLISTVLPKSMIEVEAGSAEIRAIGGDFGLLEFNGTSIPGDMLIKLQDGTTITRSIDAVTSFFGVIGIGESVTSLHVGAVANAPLVTVSSMVIAATPSPATWPLTMGAVLLLGRTRRRHRSWALPADSVAK